MTLSTSPGLSEGPADTIDAVDTVNALDQLQVRVCSNTSSEGGPQRPSGSSSSSSTSLPEVTGMMLEWDWLNGNRYHSPAAEMVWRNLPAPLLAHAGICTTMLRWREPAYGAPDARRQLHGCMPAHNHVYPVSADVRNLGDSHAASRCSGMCAGLPRSKLLWRMGRICWSGGQEHSPMIAMPTVAAP